MAFHSTIVFVIDNSASMNQHCYLGTSLLDVAKNSIDNFIVKKRARSDDRYVLLTLGDRKTSVLSGLKDSANHTLVLSRLRNIQANGYTSFGDTLKVAFDLLNLPRLHQKLDMYGLGRSPYHSSPAVIVCVTDGCKMSTLSTCVDKLNLPMNDPLPGNELTHEPFRWDCRVYCMLLRLPGNLNGVSEAGQLHQHPITSMCDVTGGRSYLITNKATLSQSWDSINTKIQRGVVIKFERSCNIKVVQTANNVTVYDPCHDPKEAEHREEIKDNFQNSTRLVLIKNPVQGQKIMQSNWPIPESYFGLTENKAIPKRMAHPVLKFVQKDEKVVLMPDFAFDKYELEASPLSSLMVEKLNQNCCWYVYVEKSGAKTGVHHLCGFLKLSSPNQQTQERKAQLYIMPYNFPRLVPLLMELKAKKLTNDLILKINDYAKRCPVYYMQYLIKAMRAFLNKCNLHQQYVSQMIPDHLEHQYKYHVNEYMKNICEQIRTYPEFTSYQPDNYVKGILIDQTMSKFKSEVNEVKEIPNFRVGYYSKNKSNFYFDPLATSRGSLLNQMENMKLNLHQLIHSSFTIQGEMIGDVNFSSSRIKLQDKRDLHCKKLKDMGDYKQLEQNTRDRLRSAEEEDGDRPRNTFGNPFTNKRREDKPMMFDETENYDKPEAQEAQKKPKKPWRKGKHSVHTILAKKYRGSISRPNFKRSQTPPPPSMVYSEIEDSDAESIYSLPEFHNKPDFFEDKPSVEDFKIELEFKPIKLEPPKADKRKSPVVVIEPYEKKIKLSPKPKPSEDISSEEFSKLRSEAISHIKNWGSCYKKIELMLKNISSKKGENKNKLLTDIKFWATEFKRRSVIKFVSKYTD